MARLSIHGQGMTVESLVYLQINPHKPQEQLRAAPPLMLESLKANRCAEAMTAWYRRRLFPQNSTALA
jgi:hypothetical protein